MHRAAAWLAKAGVGQFLDIGTGIPTEPNLHQIVQAIRPDARIVYADNDPIVLRHAEALLTSNRAGATDFLLADVRQPEAILERAREILDFEHPIALSLIALLHFLPDDEDPYRIVRTLVEELLRQLPASLARDRRPAPGAEAGDRGRVQEGCDPAADAHPR
ncbi:hypothetical protein SHKM778_36020 [Streptomyces sp. KM77-8]|uniref:SAM-dependent methyltransferase n=1 Tax=Streptomyces haneummycinicus TaxID=3074435 RepID=A0AAT9HIH1_9ACTN